MKLKKLLFILIISLYSNTYGMDKSKPVLDLALNKTAKISALKLLWSKVFAHINTCEEAKKNIIRHFPLFDFLETKEIITMAASLNHILRIPQDQLGSGFTEDVKTIRSILDKLFGRKRKNDELKKSSLKNQCLHELKNISLIKFNLLCRDLQIELAEIHGKKRIDLVHACAKTGPITLKLAYIIATQLSLRHAKLYGDEAAFEKAFPQEILGYGNNQLIAYALLNR